jgi:hypothetical protein
VPQDAQWTPETVTQLPESTVDAMTGLAPHQARPKELAAWIRGYWQVENCPHWVRDATYAEDLSRRWGTASRRSAWSPCHRPALDGGAGGRLARGAIRGANWCQGSRVEPINHTGAPKKPLVAGDETRDEVSPKAGVAGSNPAGGTDQ